MKPFYFARIVLVTLSCIYACAVCTSGNDGAMVDLTQPTEPRYDHPQCSIFEKTKPSNNIRFNTKRKDWAQCSIFEKTKPSNKIRFNTKRKDWGEIPKSKMGWHEIYFQLQMNWPIMPAYPPMLILRAIPRAHARRSHYYNTEIIFMYRLYSNITHDPI